jgi:hypothetical protein
MNTKSNLIAVKSLLILFCSVVFSFSPKTGGDSFEIWLNGKRILQQYVYIAKGVQTLELTSTSDNDKLDIYYSHCGQIGKSRYITIKDEKERSLKVWKFADTPGKNAAMSFKLKDILGLRKNKTDKLNLFYTSHELPDGRLLATIISENETGIARK